VLLTTSVTIIQTDKLGFTQSTRVPQRCFGLTVQLSWQKSIVISI